MVRIVLNEHVKGLGFPLKCQKPLTQQSSITSQETGILDYTAVKTSKIAKNDISIINVIVKQPHTH
jgi:hypothetical protein